MRTINPSRTAIRRASLSRPVGLALQDGLISRNRTFFDYGCGRGGDLKRLHQLGVPVSGWDPAFFPDEERQPADIVNLGYVVNVIEDPEERGIVLNAAWELTRRVLIVSARLEFEAKRLNGEFQGDGIVTGKQTFQKFFTQEELRDWVKEGLGHQCVAAAPGIFYVFRNNNEEQGFAASRFRQRRSIPTAQLNEQLFEANRGLLDPLMEFVTERGRLPFDTELEQAQELRKEFGSIQASFSLIRRITGTERWDRIRRQRQADLLVYVALAAFSGRPRFGGLPENVRHDIRAMFGSYKKACRLADEALFAAGDREAVDASCRGVEVGKLLPDALYVHPSVLPSLPVVLRVYEGCARQLVGAVDGTSLIKLKRPKAKVSYLVYSNFDKDAHPALLESFVADLTRLRIHHRGYRTSDNPPILHRKERFVATDYPHRAKFARLTGQEERAGVLDSALIGTRQGWATVLRNKALECRGHRLVRLSK